MEDNLLREADDQLKAQILDQIPTPVMAVNKDLGVIYMNEAGKKLLNKSENGIIGSVCKELISTEQCNTAECGMIKAINSGETYSARTNADLGGHVIPVEFSAVPLRDENGEIIGGLEFVLDITERVLYENRLKEQSHTIREMSTPTIKLWEGVMVLPIVGVVDSMRAQHMMESMLSKIAETYAKVIILDIHGVAAVDTAVANHLIKITKATKLMGCECILSGISPAVAQTIIQLGIDMDAINTRATLSDALSEAFTMLNLKVCKKK
ncbi:PAS domain-containing protein [Acetobacterium woodii]|uniref:RsbT co-antagonist protein rsbRA n=1 Tax=Acetobacterium woodii (strain ATCC 29683 / DSM 1030 / JCM 2381 / KCTC 1655 / WB1) TaxID=931626 RepID=H6LI01_ACEWD|nr:PAS domain-containing protein [Acetobacterium woodii]AFA48531.1 RsbT co-antagonist protein rsbRA [Acetobacterium woodii DSM 1030]